LQVIRIINNFKTDSVRTKTFYWTKWIWRILTYFSRFFLSFFTSIFFLVLLLQWRELLFCLTISQRISALPFDLERKDGNLGRFIYKPVKQSLIFKTIEATEVFEVKNIKVLRWNWGKLNWHFTVAIENIKPQKLQLYLSLISNISNELWPLNIVLNYFFPNSVMSHNWPSPVRNKKFFSENFQLQKQIPSAR
jgi:hypothetical protein